LKADVFSNPGVGLTSSFTTTKDEEWRSNLPVFLSLRLCRLSSLVIFDCGGCGYGHSGGPRR